MAYGNKTTPAVGTGLPFDDIGPASFPRSKQALGAEGEAVDAVGGAGVVGPGVQRMTLADDDVLVSRIGAANDAAPASDTASSPINGRLQRIAQRLTSLIGGIGAGNDAAAADETSNLGLVALLKGLFRDVRARLGAVADAAWTGTGNGSVISILKTIAAGVLDTATPAGVTRAGTIRSYAVVTNANLAASFALPAPPAGAKSMILIAEGQDVRFNPDGAATATSVPIKAGQPGYELPLPATPGNARLIRAADGATLHILWVG